MYDAQELREFSSHSHGQNRVYIQEPALEIEEETPVPSELEAVNYLVWRRLQLSKAKLKGVTEMAALMAGFSVVATVELDISKANNNLLLVAFTTTTAILVSTTMFSILIATCLLPHIEAVTKVNSVNLARDSPHEDLIWYIDLAWFLANTVSICLFILDVVLLSWIKFSRVPAICITSIMVPVLFLLCIFSVVFYRQTVHHQIDLADKRYSELKAMGRKLRIGISVSEGGVMSV